MERVSRSRWPPDRSRSRSPRKVVGVDFLYYRPLVYAWIPAAIAVAAVLAAPRLGRAGVAAAVVVFAGLLACTIAIAARPSLHREDWRGVTAAIGPRDPQRAIYVRSWWPTSGFEYYRPTVRMPENGVRVASWSRSASAA